MTSGEGLTVAVKGQGIVSCSLDSLSVHLRQNFGDILSFVASSVIVLEICCAWLELLQKVIPMQVENLDCSQTFLFHTMLH